MLIFLKLIQKFCVIRIMIMTEYVFGKLVPESYMEILWFKIILKSKVRGVLSRYSISMAFNTG